MTFRVDRNPDAFPFQWQWTRVDQLGRPVPDSDGTVRTHSGYPFRWVAELAARLGTRA